MSEPVFHDVAWFAERIGMKPEWVRSHLGGIPHHKVGRFVKFTEENVAEFVAITKRPSEGAYVELTDRSRTHRDRRNRLGQ